MNPSTDDIIRAVDSVPGRGRFRAPNNKNIIMAAEQAVHLSEEKKLVVVPTKTIPQGISAMLAVDPDAEQDTELATAMTEAASHVRSGQVTYAARDSEFDGKKIKQGEYLSLSEGRLCASGRETSVLKKLVREMVSDDSAFATVIFGEGVTGGAGRRGRKPASQGKQGYGDLGHQRRSAGVLLYPVRRVKNTRFRALTDGRRVGIIQIEGHRCAVGL